jgi:hypothetical protein
MAAEWIASGLALTDMVVSKGHSLLYQYRVIETVQPYVQRAQDVATAQATKMNERYRLSERAQHLEETYHVTERVSQAKAYLFEAVNKATNTVRDRTSGCVF